MQWSAGNYAGFSNSEPWIVVNENYKDINVVNALKDKNSLFYTYKNLISLRKNEKILTEGTFELLDLGETVFAYKRLYKQEQLTVISNLTDKDLEINYEIDGDLIMSNYENSGNLYKAYETRVYLKK